MFANKGLQRALNYLSPLLVLVNFAAALSVLFQVWGGQTMEYILPWLHITDGLRVDWAIRIDLPAAIMLVLVSFIGFWVHLFSLSYLKGEPFLHRYWGYLGFFCAAMSALVVCNDLLTLFICWEWVGFSSFLLIGFWFHKNEAALAARNAFWVNRLGDAAMILGVFLFWSQYETLNIGELTKLGALHQDTILTVACLLLFGGVVSKSAQFPLQIWLPDAMAGPTPASALIHAATMVAAGVYLLCRVVPFFPSDALWVVANTGAVTAFMGAFAALFQTDIKRVLAYSTISQLGFMVLAAGLGAPAAAMFHLLTHAFFKAALFLASGQIIHTLHHLQHEKHLTFDAQNLTIMGGLRRYLPLNFVVYLLCSAALAGVPFTSGFLSKELILSGAMAQNYAYLPFLAFAASGLTAFYMTRQMLLIFAGNIRVLPQPTSSDVEVLKKTDWKMNAALVALALFSIGFLWSFFPVANSGENGMYHLLYENGILVFSSKDPVYPIQNQTIILSLISLFTGVGLAFILYKKDRLLLKTPYSFLAKLSTENFFLSAFYRFSVKKPLLFTSFGFHNIDVWVVDGLVNFVANFSAKMEMGQTDVSISAAASATDRFLIDGAVNGTAKTLAKVGRAFQKLQTGSVQTYILWSVLILTLTFLSLLFLIF